MSYDVREESEIVAGVRWQDLCGVLRRKGGQRAWEVARSLHVVKDGSTRHHRSPGSLTLLETAPAEWVLGLLAIAKGSEGLALGALASRLGTRRGADALVPRAALVDTGPLTLSAMARLEDVVVVVATRRVPVV